MHEIYQRVRFGWIAGEKRTRLKLGAWKIVLAESKGIGAWKFDCLGSESGVRLSMTCEPKSLYVRCKND
jgi:hypothetical protein